MIDRKLTMAYVAGRISECFKNNIFVIWSEDNAEKLIVRCRVLSAHDKDDASVVEAAREHYAQLRQLVRRGL